MILFVLILLLSSTLTQSQRTINHPFLWFEDDFDSLDSNIWDRNPENPATSFTSASGGQLFVQLSGSDAYLNPNLTSTTSWNLPAGANLDSISVGLLGGTAIPRENCCNSQMTFGISGLHYGRELPFSNAVTSSQNCEFNGTCFFYTNLTRCGFTESAWTERFYTSAGTLVSASSRVCIGDRCGCGARGIATLPSQNYTQVLSRVGSNYRVTLPGFGTVATTVSASLFPLSGPKLGFIRIGGAQPAGADGQATWYTTNNGANRRWPSTVSFDKLEILFPGQCYDNNTVSGDGCNATYVEPFCFCQRSSNRWGRSQCSCATTSANYLSLPFQRKVDLLDPTETAYPSNSINDIVSINYTGSPIVSLSQCPHPSLACNDTNPLRFLVVIVNGSVAASGPIVFMNSSALLFGQSFLTVNLSSFGAPYRIGSTVKFIFWSNVRAGQPAGIFDLNGPALAASPTYNVVRSDFTVYSTENFTAGGVEVIGGFNSTISFSSNVRFPEVIQIWVYDGNIPFESSNALDFAEDTSLTRVQINSCSHRAASSGSILHTCSVNIPAVFRPSYLVARVALGDQQLGKIRSIAYSVLPRPQPNQLSYPVAQNIIFITITGVSMDVRASWRVSVGETGQSTVLDTTFNAINSTHLQFTLLSPINVLGNVFLHWTLLGYSGIVNVSTVYPAPPSIIREANRLFYSDTVTITFRGSGFVSGQPNANKLILSQPGIPSTPTGIISQVNSTHIVFKLQSRIPTGALFASVAVYDGLPSEPTAIGFYNGFSVFNRISFPADLDLSVAPRLQFTLSSNSFLDGPTTASQSQIAAKLANLTNLQSSDLYVRYSQISSNATAYTLEVWFVTPSASEAFNSKRLSANATLIAVISNIVSSITGDVFDVRLTQATDSVDAAWPFMIYGLSAVSPLANKLPSNSEMADLRILMGIFWGISMDDVEIQLRRPVSSQYLFELGFYFKTASSQDFFKGQRLPENINLTRGVDEIISVALGDSFLVIFLRASPLEKQERQINVDWLWLKFLLMQTSTDSSITLPVLGDNIAAGVSERLALTSEDIYIQFLSSASSKREALSDTFMTVFFTTSNARAAILATGAPANTLFLTTISNIVSNASSTSYNASFVESNIVAPSAAGVQIQPTPFPLWQVVVGSVAAVLFLIAVAIIIVVVYRRKFRAVENLEKAMVEIPDEFSGMFSIKATELNMGKKLGEGSFGAVYEATYKGKPVAVKKLADNMLAASVSDFFREAALMLGIPPHPNVILTHGMCQEFGKFSMVMELAGSSLDKLVESRQVSATGNQLSEGTLLSLAKGIASGMNHLAKHRIVHRDLAARNILLSESLEPKISDFGFSRVVGSEENGGKTVSTVGPIRWMSPENIGQQRYSEKSDVWSYGCLLIELITGEDPFHETDDIVEVAVKIRDGQATALDSVPKVLLAPWLASLLHMCFEYSEESRPTFEEIVSYLAQVVPSGAHNRLSRPPTIELHDSEQSEPRHTGPTIYGPIKLD